MRRRLLVLLAATFVLSGTTLLRGQVSGARIDGIISDKQSLPMAGVKVTLTEIRTALSRTTLTSATGTYEFPSLNPGAYELKVEAQGFGTEVRSLTLEVNQAVHLDVSPTVGKVAQNLRVVGTADTLRTTDASLGEVVEPTMTQQLPLNGRHLIRPGLACACGSRRFWSSDR